MELRSAMKYRITTIAMLMLAFFLKDAVTLVLVSSDMANAEMSAGGPLTALPPIAPLAPVALAPVALAAPNAPPVALATLDAVPLGQMVSAVPTAAMESDAPPLCHAAPFSDQQTPLPQIGTGPQRVLTLGASGASGLEAILLGSVLLGVSSVLARRRAAWRRMVGFVPAVTLPPG
jgi:hypothetical protein